MSKGSSFQIVTSKFTRKSGYIDIKSSEKLNHKKVIELLNSFTPQGASPKLSVRVGSWNNKIGISYYCMEDDENALLSTVLMDKEEFDLNTLNIPLNENSIAYLAKGKHENYLFQQYEVTENLLAQFDGHDASMILYSLLAGDNMIIIHPSHEQRLRFIDILIKLIPNVFFKYNRITTSCSELDGNENIIGVDKLPHKYRSHKKLYMPLDTIFIDLEENKLMGEGLKSNNLTKEIIKKYRKDIIEGRELVIEYFTKIANENYHVGKEYGENTVQLTNKIRQKLGLKIEKDENWLLSF